MLPLSIGDRARAFVLQNSAHRLKSTMDVLTEELTTGRVSDLPQRVQGNMQPIHHLESRIRMIAGFEQTTSEAALQAEGIQTVISGLRDINQKTASDLLMSMPSPTSELIGARSRNALIGLSAVVSRLNGTTAGAYMFSGVETDKAPLVSSEDIMTELTTVTAGLTTAADIQLALDNWFAAPSGGGGYLDFAYKGSLGQSREIQLSETGSATFDKDASSNEIRGLIKGLALAGLVERGALAGDLAGQRDLLVRSGTILLENEPELVSLAAETGMTQQRIEQVQAANASELASFEIARNKIVAADPFTTATALQEVQSQLEMLNTLTARISRLKLSDFLR